MLKIRYECTQMNMYIQCVYMIHFFGYHLGSRLAMMNHVWVNLSCEFDSQLHHGKKSIPIPI